MVQGSQLLAVVLVRGQESLVVHATRLQVLLLLSALLFHPVKLLFHLFELFLAVFELDVLVSSLFTDFGDLLLQFLKVFIFNVTLFDSLSRLGFQAVLLLRDLVCFDLSL